MKLVHPNNVSPLPGVAFFLGWPVGGGFLEKPIMSPMTISHPPIDIGNVVTFVHAKTTQEGTVKGTEFVDDPRRGRGWHLVVQTADLQILDIHESAVGDVVTQAR